MFCFEAGLAKALQCECLWACIFDNCCAFQADRMVTGNTLCKTELAHRHTHSHVSAKAWRACFHRHPAKKSKTRSPQPHQQTQGHKAGSEPEKRVSQPESKRQVVQQGGWTCQENSSQLSVRLKFVQPWWPARSVLLDDDDLNARMICESHSHLQHRRRGESLGPIASEVSPRFSVGRCPCDSSKRIAVSS